MQELLEHGPAPGGASLFLIGPGQRFQHAEPDRGAGGQVLGRFASEIAQITAGRGNVGAGFGFSLEVELQLGFEVRLLSAPAWEPSELAKEGAHCPSCPVGFRIRPMARESVSHFDCSAANCLRPAAVSR